MARPSPEEYAKTAAETAAALNLVVSGKIASAQPTTLPVQPGAPEYIKYTPSQQGPQYNSGATQRIIKMQVCALVAASAPFFLSAQFMHAKLHVQAPPALCFRSGSAPAACSTCS